jgi:hypothetical protein
MTLEIIDKTALDSVMQRLEQTALLIQSERKAKADTLFTKWTPESELLERTKYKSPRQLRTHLESAGVRFSELGSTRFYSTADLNRFFEQNSIRPATSRTIALCG